MSDGTRPADSRGLIDDVVELCAHRSRSTLTHDEQNTATDLLLDALGNVICGFAGPAYQLARRRSRPQSGRQSFDLIAVAAALRDFDWLDTYSAADVCHPSEAVPVLLWIADRKDMSGREFLSLLASAYELQGRLADAVNLRRDNLHYSTNAALVVPAALYGAGELTAEELGAALSLAVAHGGVHRSISKGVVTGAKAFAYGMAATAAIQAAELAAAGLDGPRDVLDAMVVAAGGDRAKVSESLLYEAERSTRMSGIAVKQYPVQYGLQAVVEAGAHIFAEGIDRRTVTRVLVFGSVDVVGNTSDEHKRAPQSRETADHSVYAVLAMAIAHGDVTVGDLLDRRWTTPAATRLASIVDVAPVLGDGELAARGLSRIGVEIEVHTADGSRRTFTVPAPTGSPNRPLDHHGIRAKFDRAAGLGGSPAAAGQVAALVEDLPTAPSMAPLLQALALAAPKWGAVK